MANDNIHLSDSEALLVRQLRERPELCERFRDLFEIVESRPGELRKADDVEALLVEVIRSLGKDAMESWARSAEAEAAGQAKQQDPGLHVAKKKR
jgi:hypothetical protein